MDLPKSAAVKPEQIDRLQRLEKIAPGLARRRHLPGRSPEPRRRGRLQPLLCAALLWGASFAVAGSLHPVAGSDWPGLWGPERTARIAGFLPAGSAVELRELWRWPLGKGYSEVIAVENRGYTLFTDGTTDFLVSFDIATSKEIWRAPIGKMHRGRDGSDDGPISTPLFADGRVFALSPSGKLFAFDAASGRELWVRDLVAEFAAVAPYFGFGTSPLVIGHSLLVQTGGEKQHNLVALDTASGRTLWTSHPAKTSGYSSPVSLTLGGIAHVMAATSDKVFGFDPANGSVLWSHPAVGEPRQSPVLLPGGRIFINSWEDSAVLQILDKGGKLEVKEVWRKPVLKGTYSPVVVRGDYLYGMNGAYLSCVESTTGKVRWSHKIDDASLILVGDHLAVLGQRTGRFHLVEASPAGFREKLQVRAFDPGPRSATGPTFAKGRFLLRKMREVVAFEVQVGPAAVRTRARDQRGGGQQ